MLVWSHHMSIHLIKHAATFWNAGADKKQLFVMSPKCYLGGYFDKNQTIADI